MRLPALASQGWFLTPASPGRHRGSEGRCALWSALALLPQRAGEPHSHTWDCELQMSWGNFACRRLLPREGKACSEINACVGFCLFERCLLSCWLYPIS